MENGFSEAPASWNVRYITPDGFSCQLTLRGESGADLLPKTEVTVKWLLEHGCRPANGCLHGNGNDEGQQANGKAGNEPQPASTLADGSPDPGWCPIHRCAMKRREKDGQVWYSHKAPDGQWCKGKGG